MNNKQIDNVSKLERKHFLYIVGQISQRFKVVFRSNKAFITYDEPYQPSELQLSAKSRAVQGLNKALIEFRQYQFDNETKAQKINKLGQD